MTFREKLAMEHPDKVTDDAFGGCFGCPKDYGYEPNEHCEHNLFYCEKCWDREIPGTEPINVKEIMEEPIVYPQFIVFDDEPTEDIINHPNHYTNGGMECIEEMLLVFGREITAHFCLCNAWKYRYRALSKNGQEDIDKSHWYMAKYKEIIQTPLLGEGVNNVKSI